MLTYFSFDRNVWKRDIDSSPAPFPFEIILAILLPCFFSRPNLAPLPFPSDPVDTTPVIRPPCTLQGPCECPSKLDLVPQDDSTHAYLEDTSTPTVATNVLAQTRRTSIAASETRLSIISRISKRNSIPSSQSLVQIPSATQRRMSIPLTLSVWSDEREDV